MNFEDLTKVIKEIKRPAGYYILNESLKNYLHQFDLIYLDIFGDYRLINNRVKILFNKEVPKNKAYYVSEENEKKMNEMFKSSSLMLNVSMTDS